MEAPGDAEKLVTELRTKIRGVLDDLDRLQANTIARGGRTASTRRDSAVQAELSAGAATRIIGALRPSPASGGTLFSTGSAAAATGGGLRGTAAADARAPFEFQRPRRRINWRSVHSLDLQKLTAGGGAAILATLSETAQGDLDSDSVFNLSEGNLIKLVKLCQLQLQYMQWLLASRAEADAALEDARAALAAGLAAMPRPGLGEVSAALGGLREGVLQVGERRLNEVFSMVRAHEQDLARAAVAQAVEAAKQRAGVEQQSSGGGGSGAGGVADTVTA